MKYYRRYMGDYGRDTAHLTLAEHGAYALLLDAQYSTEEPLPEDMNSLYKICRATTKSERMAVKNVAEKFFPSTPKGRINPRAGSELKKASQAVENMRKAGKRGAEKRWGTPQEPHGVPQENPNGEASGVQIHPPTTKEKTTSSSLRSEDDAGASPDAVIWDSGLRLLTSSGVSEAQARSFLGGLRKRHDDDELAAVVWRCMSEKPVEPRAWIKAALGDRKRRVVV